MAAITNFSKWHGDIIKRYIKAVVREQKRKMDPMHTEFTLKIEFHAPSKQALATFVQALREAGQELYAQGALLSGDTPTITLTIENNTIGTKQIKVFDEETNNG